MLHHQTKKKAATKYGNLIKEGKTREEVETLMLEEEYSVEEIKEIFAAIDAPPSPEKVAKEEKTASPNDALDLSEFNYKLLKGESFKKYVELVGDRSYTEIVEGEVIPVRGTLLENDQYDFEQYKVKPIRKMRYAGVEKSPMDYIGLELVNDTPIHVSRMTVKTALELNSQILNQHSIAGHGKYYLLKK